MADSYIWQLFQRCFLRYEDLGFSIDICRTNFTNDFFARMQCRVDKVFKAMGELEAGTIVNPVAAEQTGSG